MKRNQVIQWLTGLILVSLSAIALGLGKACAQELPVPSAMREFRAAWVATVDNINWPSKPGLSTAEQQAEALKLLDFLRDHHFNAVIFQVRPQADALYPSVLEPWSYYLTGKQGEAPEPYYDPLAFWIEEAHRRGLELHVWLNPYRAHHPAAGPVEPPSMVHRMRESVVPLKEGYWWFDPAKQTTQDHAAAVVRDIVLRYDIDGVHFDDYFYPYASYNGGADFPDDDSWEAYRRSGGMLSRGDWRRSQVNRFVERIYREIKAVRKRVKFGISPFGIWRPGHPEGISGMDQYEQLYADARLWLNEGWVDYFAPQLYWPIDRLSQSFPVLLGWWQVENIQGRHLWPGINVGGKGDEAHIREVVSQVMVVRGMVPESKGALHWSIAPLVKYPALATALRSGPYHREALVPASPWLGDSPPETPVVSWRRSSNGIDLHWEHPAPDSVFRWVVYSCYSDVWDYRIQTSAERATTLATTTSGRSPLKAVIVTAVDRLGNESAKIIHMID